MGSSWIKMYDSRRFLRDYCRFSVRGLPNYSLSCCINALLQSYSATTELLELLNRWYPSKSELDTVPGQLKKALCAMRDPSHCSPHREFLNCLHDHHSIHHFVQHDADEIFHIVLNLTQKQMPDKELAQEIRRLYEIRVETQLMCDTCRNIRRASSSLFSLPLAICEERNTLENCIQYFSQQQPLMDGETCYCDECAEKTPSTHTLKLLSLPAVLCVHLKRFRNNRGFIRKLDNTVTFPETLSLNVFDAEQSNNGDEYYSLYAVIVHIGTATSGHYTAFIRSNPDQGWFYADDSFVKQVTWADVCETYEGRRTAYLLLYRKMMRSSSGQQISVVTESS